MFEFMRKLTADYTEAEYQEWLEEKEVEPKEELSALLGKLIDMVQYSAEWHQKNLGKYDGLEFNTMRDVSDALCEVADDTGYHYEFLADMVDEEVKENESSFKDAFMTVATISYEHDW